LHIHLDCCFGIEWVFSSIFYHLFHFFSKFMEKCLSPNVYVNLTNQRLSYRKNHPGPGFKQLIKLREEAEDKQKFDQELRKSVQLDEKDVQNEQDIWETFETKILKISELILFKDNFYEHILLLAKGFIKEGVFHLEAREFLNVIMDEV